jgi:hypothetical protein
VSGGTGRGLPADRGYAKTIGASGIRMWNRIRI